jgi:hypothetical protein
VRVHGRPVHGIHGAAHGRPGVARGVAHPGSPAHPGSVAYPGAVSHPGSVTHPGTVGAARVGSAGSRQGRVVGGQCSCAACPTCGAPGAVHTAAPAAVHATAPAPAYCRCCGQVIR